MPFEIPMPQLGLTMERGTVVEWLVQEGDQISAGQEICTVETDKSVVAIQAREEGTIARILVAANREVPVGTVLAVGLAAGESWADMPYGDPPPTADLPQATVTDSPIPAQPAPHADGKGPIQAAWKARSLAKEAGLALSTLAGSGPGGRIVAADVTAWLARGQTGAPEVRATPVAARLAASLGLDLAQVAGRGPQQRISQEDVLAAVAAIIGQREPTGAASGPGLLGATGVAPAGGWPLPTGTPPGPGLLVPTGSAPEPSLPAPASTIPLQGVRRIVSEGMATSVHSTARVALCREVDAGRLIDLRQRFQALGQAVSYNDLLIWICARALRQHPEANARLGEGQIEILDRVNVGLAVDTERGLLVPVIHHADRLTIPQIAAERARLVEAARAGRSQPDDLSGGTFTITNLGMYGVEAFTPVINLPECCILGVGRMVRKPVAVGPNDVVAVRPMMSLSLVFDHRVIDGAPAARFLAQIAQWVEDPLLLLVEA